jgi:hypothetical protein
VKLDRLAHWAEILANFGVIVTLVLLTLQVRDNTNALQGQAVFQRGAAFTAPYLSESRAPAILAKIKAVDGVEPVVAAYMERYDLTYEEGAVWLRHVFSIWTSLEAEYAVLGESPDLAHRIQLLFPYPDQEIWLDNEGTSFLSTPRFRDYVERLRAEP